MIPVSCEIIEIIGLLNPYTNMIKEFNDPIFRHYKTILRHEDKELIGFLVKSDYEQVTFYEYWYFLTKFIKSMYSWNGKKIRYEDWLRKNNITITSHEFIHELYNTYSTFAKQCKVFFEQCGLDFNMLIILSHNESIKLVKLREITYRFI